MEEAEKKPFPWEEKETLPEAPVSITIKGYYKGFSVLITRRKTSMEEKQLTSIQKTIDNMVDKGFAPSWNEKTNGDHKEPTKPLQRPCNHEGCQGTQTFRQGVSKKTGKPWKAWFCDLSEEHADFIK